MRDYKRFRNTKAQKKLQEIINTHKKMRGAYFFRPPSSALRRRNYEIARSSHMTFSINGVAYEIDQITECSCKNVYYSLSVVVGGRKKNVRALKKLVAL